ncbi:MAG: ComEC/Rec2 family competence protein [Oscillospiraceae bacterium]|nr:ComEC/Rec2 family competence protein [Oscillospiraceae bacterium]
MTRKMAYVGFSFAAGLFIAMTAGDIPSAVMIAVLAVASGISAAAHAKGISPARTVTAAVCCICAAVGIMYCKAYEHTVYDRAAAYIGSAFHYSGRITGISEAGSDRVIYTLKGSINGNTPASIVLYAPGADCSPGDDITFYAKGKGITDSYTFPAESYYKCRGIYLCAEANSVTITHNDSFSAKRIAYRFEKYISSLIGYSLGGREGDMLTAMLTGSRSGVSEQMKTALYHLGCGHIMAVSGIHLTVLFAFVYRLLLLIPHMGKKPAMLISFIPALFFCCASGMSISAVRALIMLAFLNAGTFFMRKSDTMNTLGISVLALTLPMPYALLDSGLILSFAGAIGIGAVAPAVTNAIYDGSEHEPKENRLKYRLINIPVSSLCVYLTVFPAAVLIFDEVSVISPITNILFVPLCTAALISGFLAAAVSFIPVLPTAFLTIAGLFCKPVLAAADIASEVHLFTLPSGSGAARYITAAAGLMIILIYPSRIKDKALRRLVFAAALTASASALLISGIYRQRQLDRTALTYLYDSGSAAVIVCSGKNTSVFALTGGTSGMCGKYLRSRGIYSLDMILLAKRPASSAAEYSRGYVTASFFVPEGMISADDLPGSAEMYEYRSGAVIDGGYYTAAINDNAFVFTINGTSVTVSGTEGDIVYKGENADTACTEYIFENDTVTERMIFDG